MAKESSKKQIILSYWRGTGIERVGRLEIRAIQAELRRRLGDAGGGSPSYVAAVLREAGARVDY